MKTKLFTLALLLMSAGAFAQTLADNTQSESRTSDEEAVKKTIEGVTTAMYARNFKTYLNYWVNAPYVSRVSTDREGKVTKMTGDEYRKQVEQYATQNLKPSQEKATRDNWVIRINGNSAFAVFDQHNQYPDGTTRHSVEERYLERMNGEWKLVNVTVLVAAQNNQTKLDEDAVRKVLETETRAYHEANGDLLTAQWSTAPYAERQQPLLTGAVGKPFVKGDQLRGFADAFLKTHKPTGQTTRMSDYDVHISGATAWATFTNETLDGSGKVVNTQREVKILERGSARDAGSGWKIVFLGTQGMK